MLVGCLAVRRWCEPCVGYRRVAEDQILKPTEITDVGQFRIGNMSSVVAIEIEVGMPR